MIKRYRLQIISSLLGALGGYLLLHPYVMLVYALVHFHEANSFHFHWKDLAEKAFTVFHPMMLPMAAPFAIFGAVIGLLVGILMDRNRQLVAAEHEGREKRIALDTLKQVMVTLAHHLLNANMIIGGKVRHCRKAISDGDILAALGVIEEQGRKIDAVVSALRESTEIRIARYTTDDKVQMIDISKEIEDRLNRAKKSPSD
jgi:hypothetical protein